MFYYPKMTNSKTTRLLEGEEVMLFEKLDGTNLSWAWNVKRGWHKQGTRTRLFDSSDQQFGFSVQLFAELRKLNNDFDKFKTHKQLFVTTELYGPNSFAGSHFDDELKLYVIDIIVDDTFLLPTELLSVNQSAPHVGTTIWSNDLVESIRVSNHNEGVIAKSTSRPGVQSKIKTLSYLEKIKGDNSLWE